MNPAWIVFVFINSHKIQFKIFFLGRRVILYFWPVELRLQAPPQGLSVGKGVFPGGAVAAIPSPVPFQETLESLYKQGRA